MNTLKNVDGLGLSGKSRYSSENKNKSSDVILNAVEFDSFLSNPDISISIATNDKSIKSEKSEPAVLGIEETVKQSQFDGLPINSSLAESLNHEIPEEVSNENQIVNYNPKEIKETIQSDISETENLNRGFTFEVVSDSKNIISDYDSVKAVGNDFNPFVNYNPNQAENIDFQKDSHSSPSELLQILSAQNSKISQNGFNQNEENQTGEINLNSDLKNIDSTTKIDSNSLLEITDTSNPVNAKTTVEELKTVTNDNKAKVAINTVDGKIKSDAAAPVHTSDKSVNPVKETPVNAKTTIEELKTATNDNKAEVAVNSIDVKIKSDAASPAQTTEKPEKPVKETPVNTKSVVQDTVKTVSNENTTEVAINSIDGKIKSDAAAPVHTSDKPVNPVKGNPVNTKTVTEEIKAVSNENKTDVAVNTVDGKIKSDAAAPVHTSDKPVNPVKENPVNAKTVIEDAIKAISNVNTTDVTVNSIDVKIKPDASSPVQTTEKPVNPVKENSVNTKTVTEEIKAVTNDNKAEVGVNSVEGKIKSDAASPVQTTEKPVNPVKEAPENAKTVIEDGIKAVSNENKTHVAVNSFDGKIKSDVTSPVQTTEKSVNPVKETPENAKTVVEDGIKAVSNENKTDVAVNSVEGKIKSDVSSPVQTTEKPVNPVKETPVNAKTVIEDAIKAVSNDNTTEVAVNSVDVKIKSDAASPVQATEKTLNPVKETPVNAKTVIEDAIKTVSNENKAEVTVNTVDGKIKSDVSSPVQATEKPVNPVKENPVNAKTVVEDAIKAISNVNTTDVTVNSVDGKIKSDVSSPVQTTEKTLNPVKETPVNAKTTIEELKTATNDNKAEVAINSVDGKIKSDVSKPVQATEKPVNPFKETPVNAKTVIEDAIKAVSNDNKTDVSVNSVDEKIKSDVSSPVQTTEKSVNPVKENPVNTKTVTEEIKAVSNDNKTEVAVNSVDVKIKSDVSSPVQTTEKPVNPVKETPVNTKAVVEDTFKAVSNDNKTNVSVNSVDGKIKSDVSSPVQTTEKSVKQVKETPVNAKTVAEDTFKAVSNDNKAEVAVNSVDVKIKSDVSSPVQTTKKTLNPVKETPVNAKTVVEDAIKGVPNNVKTEVAVNTVDVKIKSDVSSPVQTTEKSVNPSTETHVNTETVIEDSTKSIVNSAQLKSNTINGKVDETQIKVPSDLNKLNERETLQKDTIEPANKIESKVVTEPEKNINVSEKNEKPVFEKDLKLSDKTEAPEISQKTDSKPAFENPEIKRNFNDKTAQSPIIIAKNSSQPVDGTALQEAFTTKKNDFAETVVPTANSKGGEIKPNHFENVNNNQSNNEVLSNESAKIKVSPEEENILKNNRINQNNTILPVNINSENKKESNILKNELQSGSRQFLNDANKISDYKNKFTGDKDKSAKKDGENKTNASKSTIEQEKADNQDVLKAENSGFSKTLENVQSKQIRSLQTQQTKPAMPSYMTFNNVKPANIPNMMRDVIGNAGPNYTGTIKLTLTPKTLGMIFVEINISDDSVKLNIKAENQETVKAIENSLSNLRDKIESNGVKLENLSISHYTGEQKKDASANRERRAGSDKKGKSGLFDMDKLLNETDSSGSIAKRSKNQYLHGNYIEKYI